MIEIYRKGLDLHVDTAAKACKQNYEWLAAMKTTNPAEFELIRQKGKSGNFGLVYSMMPMGFVEYAAKNYGVTFTLEEATEFRNLFFENKPELLVYHAQYKKFAHTHKYVPTPLGRLRHLPLIDSPIRGIASEAERQAINSPVQGTLSDLLLWSFAEEDRLGYTALAPAFGACHDAALNYVLEDRVDIDVANMLDVQENLPFHKIGWQPQLQFTADAKVGPNMADVKEWKGKRKERPAIDCTPGT
jgi:hypothetical protein